MLKVCLTCQINFVIPFLFLRLICLFMGYPMMVDSCILLGWLLCYDQYLSHMQDFNFPGYFLTLTGTLPHSIEHWCHCLVIVLVTC